MVLLSHFTHKTALLASIKSYYFIQQLSQYKKKENPKAIERVGAFYIDQSKKVDDQDNMYECYHEKTPNLKYVCKKSDNIVITQAELLGKLKQLFLKGSGKYIVPIISIELTKSHIYQIIQPYNGGNLQIYLRKNKSKLDERFVLKLFQSICIGYYKCFFKNNIIHRDLKPRNILIHDGVPLISGFHFCTSRNNVEESLEDYTCGTPRYNSPQIFLSEKKSTFSYLTDIYSLGTILYEMIYGTSPNNSNTKQALIDFYTNLQQNGSSREIKFPEVPFNIQTETKQAIIKMLEYSESDRMTIKQLINHKMFDILKPNDNQSQKTEIDPNNYVSMLKNESKIGESLNKQFIKTFLSKKNSTITSEVVMNAIQFLKKKNFETKKLVDCGAFGLVVQASDITNKRDVAIKLMIVQDKEILQEAIEEFQKNLKFNHPNVVTTYEQLYDDEHETFFIISEFCSSGNLLDYKQNRELTKGQIIKISEDIISGSIELHSMNMIHSDLKPQNILINNNFQFKICDLGLSKILINNKSHTVMKGGTMQYMSLEQINKEIRLESDIFSIGVILFFLCGFDVETNGMLCFNFKSGIFPKIDKHPQSDILQIACKMMTVDPKQRQSLKESQQQLSELLRLSNKKQKNKEGEYEGELDGNLRQGIGIQLYNKGNDIISYNGNWQNGKKDGYGVEKYSNGARFEGWFKDDVRHGEGTYYYEPTSNLLKYIGQYNLGKCYGYGAEVRRNGLIIEGEYNQD